MAEPTRPPDLSDFIAARKSYLRIFADVFMRERLDAVIFPQMRTALAPLHGGDIIHETAVCEINIAGFPEVTVPAGYYVSGAPFCLIVVGHQWAEVELLAYAYAYKQSSRHRRAPKLD
ncbi:hypothetical protein AB8B21_30365 [Tardiphaga sp. 866_E4_N2_1]|jgi:Asp-tRNA(Asn)/Glu-tRNA(Gln) amidotransferase A subunit family amidase|uniref:hypothetical protein n=1 Tax=unclassified Tardiphaga TaxID=2631404 RepID=UPI000B055ACF|nr:hypothetical protein [Tardiphaga sp. OK245]